MNSHWSHSIWRYARRRSRRALGATLLEVLVATFMSVIVVSALLSGITSIGTATRDERVLAEAQNELEAAVSFITDELKEAVFIYNGGELVNISIDGTDRPGVEQILGLNGNNNREPVLVFWKSESIPYDGTGPDVPTEADCNGLSGAARNECSELRVERRSYTLVAYILDKTPSTAFEGPARIRRYELRKYQNNQNRIDVTADRTPGYVDPQKESPAFAIWPYDSDGNPAGGAAVNLNIQSPNINANAPVLVDYIDDFTNPDIAAADLPICEGNDVTVGDAALDDAYNDLYNDRYIRTPQEAATTPAGITSFFACVRLVNPFAEQGNQDTVVYLRGNPDGRDGYRFNPDGAAPLPSVTTQVVSRGTTNKFSN